MFGWLCIVFFAAFLGVQPSWAGPCGQKEVVFEPGPAGSVQIVDWAWTYGVKDHCPAGRLGNTVAKGAPVYLWTRIAGGRDALSMLLRTGRLPFKHIWIKRIGRTCIDFDSTEVDGLAEVFRDNIVLDSDAFKAAICARNLDCSFRLKVE